MSYIIFCLFGIFLVKIKTKGFRSLMKIWEKERAHHSLCLSVPGGAWIATAYGIAKNRTPRSDNIQSLSTNLTPDALVCSSDTAFISASAYLCL